MTYENPLEIAQNDSADFILVGLYLSEFNTEQGEPLSEFETLAIALPR